MKEKLATIIHILLVSIIGGAICTVGVSVASLIDLQMKEVPFVFIVVVIPASIIFSIGVVVFMYPVFIQLNTLACLGNTSASIIGGLLTSWPVLMGVFALWVSDVHIMPWGLIFVFFNFFSGMVVGPVLKYLEFNESPST